MKRAILVGKFPARELPYSYEDHYDVLLGNFYCGTVFKLRGNVFWKASVFGHASIGQINHRTN
jgi:hypothetical protein